MNERIYYVANARMPNERAHGIQLAKMCEAFLEAGAELTLVLPRRGMRTDERIGAFYGLRREISSVYLPVLPSGKKMFFFNMSAFSFMISSFLYLLGKRIAGKGGIVYSIDLDQFSFAPLPFLGMPVFFESHAAKRKSFAHRIFLSRIRGVIVINERIKRAFMETFKLAEEKILVKPNGVDLRFFEHAERTAAGARKRFTALYVGRAYRWKGFGVFLDAARRLPEVSFRFVGGIAEELKAATDISTLPENLICEGELRYTEIPSRLAEADVLLLLGTRENEYSYRETSPMKLFEYMASRRPIVAARTPAIEEVVSEKEVFFYEPDDAKDLARAVREALAQKSEAKAKAERAYAKTKNFSWERRAKDILAFIEA